MSDFLSRQDEELTSPSSDEKMDTSDSLRSQDTNSFHSDEDNEPLRFHNPNDSLIQQMANLNIDSPKTTGISPPKFLSTLTLTTDHPLMTLSSPDDFPDLIPKKKVDDKEVSLSSMEDSKENGLYSPQRNTSKNNLYFSDNFVTAESDLPPDVAIVDKVERRKIVAKMETPVFGVRNKNSYAISGHSTPKHDGDIDITREEYHSGVAEWCESPTHQRSVPNFDLPIEMSSSLGVHNELDSPDVVSGSPQEDKSAYQALLDPYTGSVALRHTVKTTPAPPSGIRRKIMPPEDDDVCSVDSISASSMEDDADDEPPPAQCADHQLSDDEDTNKSISTNTVSYTSEPLPEYSAAEELSNERGWIHVSNAGTRHTCDMKVIEPYKRVVSHGGYSASGAALIVFSACHLPDTGRHDYTYVMDNLFLYVLWTLERLVTEEYILVYLHGSASRRRLPTFHWLHECYKLIDRRLRKSLKHLYLVHPTFWLKSFVILTKPFVSSKFFKKLSYVKNLDELMEKVPIEPNAIPELVKQYDATRRR